MALRDRRSPSLSPSSTMSSAPPSVAAGAPIEGGFQPARPLTAGRVPEPGSAMQRLQTALDELQRVRAEAISPLLQRAVDAMRADRPEEGAELALEALKVDERCGVAWHVLGVCRERSDDFTSALKCYETALRCSPDEPELSHDLGRLAYRMGMLSQAESLFRVYLARRPTSADGANNLANALRDQFRFDEAVGVIREAVRADARNPLLWNTLGTILAEQGDMPKAVLFFREALACDGAFAKARYNLANALLAQGDAHAAVRECDMALEGTGLASEVSMMRLARATMLLAAGALGDGWDAYEARLEPHYADVTVFDAQVPLWRPETPLEGRRLLLLGEQGLGDEILFASLVPDVLRALGPKGRLHLAVEPRLVALFSRSFPAVDVRPHFTLKVDHHTVRGVRPPWRWDDVDLWAPLATPLRRFRRQIGDFPEAGAGFIIPDQSRVQAWRRRLAQTHAGPCVGLVWKSGVRATNRSRHFAPFGEWEPVLRTPGAVFVNLQYGDASEEIETAASEFGVELWTPPDIDLKNDLDELAALCVALELVIGPANATTNLAAAAGASVWLLSTPGAWPKLGTERYPFYSQARVFTPPSHLNWSPAMAALGQALRLRLAGAHAGSAGT